MSSRTVRTAPLVLSAVLALAGCSSAVAGTATPGGPVDAGPNTQVRAQYDLDTGAGGEDLDDVTAAAFGNGGAYLVLRDTGTPGGLLVTVAPGDTGGEPTTSELRQIQYVDDLHATRDGRVVVVGQVDPPDSESTIFGVAVLDPDTGTGPVHDLLPDGYRNSVESAVSADGRTLYAVVDADVDGGDVLRVLAADLGSGEITASHDLDPGPGGYARPEGIVVAPDGAVTVELDVSTGDDESQLALVRFSPALEPRGEPVALTEPVDDVDGEGLGVTADGTVVALVEDSTARIVSLPPDADQPAVVAEVDDSFYGFAVHPAGHWAYAVNDDDLPVAIDLTTGQVGEPAPICDGQPEVDALLVSGSSVVVQGYCGGEAAKVWVLGPAQ